MLGVLENAWFWRPAMAVSGVSGRALDIQRLHAIPLAHLESKLVAFKHHPFPTQNQAPFHDAKALTTPTLTKFPQQSEVFNWCTHNASQNLRS